MYVLLKKQKYHVLMFDQALDSRQLLYDLSSVLVSRVPALRRHWTVCGVDVCTYILHTVRIR